MARALFTFFDNIDLFGYFRNLGNGTSNYCVKGGHRQHFPGQDYSKSLERDHHEIGEEGEGGTEIGGMG